MVGGNSPGVESGGQVGLGDGCQGVVGSREIPMFRIWQIMGVQGTLGPAFNELGYNEHPAIMSNFPSGKTPDWINVKKVQLQRVQLKTSKFLVNLSHSL